jgi:hypothetical protein
LVLEGEAVVDKTTRGCKGVESARRRRYSVLESQPAADARLAFAGVGDLLKAVLPDVMGRFPAPQADALVLRCCLRVRAVRRRMSAPSPWRCVARSERSVWLGRCCWR